MHSSRLYWPELIGADGAPDIPAAEEEAVDALKRKGAAPGGSVITLDVRPQGVYMSATVDGRPDASYLLLSDEKLLSRALPELLAELRAASQLKEAANV